MEFKELIETTRRTSTYRANYMGVSERLDSIR